MRVDTVLLLAAALVASPASAIARNAFNTNIFSGHLVNLCVNINILNKLFINIIVDVFHSVLHSLF
ncbi:hypothetical protein MY11210_000109 [Beauveria gryllotalpidicola]